MSQRIRIPRLPDEQLHLIESWPFILMHLLPLGVFWTGMRFSDLVLCFILYGVRMFFITAGYHRYFAHRSYQMGRIMQFIMAFGGAMAAQKGPLWWASHHRMHHAFTDTPQDLHTPRKGFWWSHVGWVLSRKYRKTETGWIHDFDRYPELAWIDRHYLVPPTILGVLVFLFGGWSALFGGFFLSTVLLYHGTFTINSLTHLFGKQRYQTNDDSRNSFLLALITCGEGWHNNHHYYKKSARQGFFWWEVDISYYILVILNYLKLVRALQPAPTETQKSI